MHPLLSNGSLWWCILLGHLFVSMPFLTYGKFMNEKIESGIFLRQYSESVPGSGYKGNITHYINKSASFSSSDILLSCEDLKGVGSLNTTCVVNSDLYLSEGLDVFGTGNLQLRPHISIICLIEGCSISFNLSGNVEVGQYASLVAGSVTIAATNLILHSNSFINTSALGGPPPTQTSGTPYGHDGAGGGHGGRGASCLKNNVTNTWGGDVYAWSTLDDPWSYGSKGGSTTAEMQLGGNGGGKVKLVVKDVLYLNGSVTAEGGLGGLKGGGGSGGSIKIHALKLKGTGTISASGGRGWGGGGGGRISFDCYSIQEDIKIIAHGGESIGCPGNAGAAGTVFDSTLQSLRVSNANVSTRTETPLLDFPTRSLWSNVFVENNAKVLVPLLWSRMQVRGQISILYGGSVSFGLSEYPVSEFELVAEELLMSDSTIEVFGAFRIIVKMLLMWNSEIQIDGGGFSNVATSVLEVRNLVVLRENSIISSNANLGLYGQGLLKLTGHGDAIKAQRLFLSLFYNITVGAGALVQAPLDDKNGRNMATKSHCESHSCPTDLIYPPEDCHVNNTLSFSLQICRVEDLTVSGFVKGSILHIRAKTVIIAPDGMISASEFGCEEGIGKGNYSNGAGGGAGHGGKGGSGYSNGMLREGGKTYGDAELPCELGSGSGSSSESYGNIVGGGMIVMGSAQWPLTRLDVFGSLRADGQSYSRARGNTSSTITDGLGGGSGGTILLFLQELTLGDHSSLSVAGGNGGPAGGGGGGGGRVHFDWSRIATGDEYLPVASLNGTINNSGGMGRNRGSHGENGTITGKKCPRGLYGTFCHECPIGTYKDVDGSDASLCSPCPLELLPQRADFIYVRGGVCEPFCPYKCMSEKYRMPNCYTPLEELIYTFGGPWLFSAILSFVLVLLAVLLSTIRVKLVGSDSYRTVNSSEHQNRHHFHYLLSLAEVRGTSRAEETHSHVHRLHFMGPNTFREPWHLPYSPPDAIIGIVYEDAFNRFIDEINSVAAYEWWEGSVHSILSNIAYPCAWSWKQWLRRNKIHRLQEFVKSEYDHSCLRSCRSRALYKGMKVGATPDLMVAYIDFFLGGDEKRLDVASIQQQRFPICVIFGGDGSYMSAYNLHCDTLLTNLLSEHVPATIWNRLVDGLNAQLRTVRQGSIRSALVPVLNWIKTHGNPKLEPNGVRIEVGWFQATASGYYQLGILIAISDYSVHQMHRSDSWGGSSSEQPRKTATSALKSIKQLQESLPCTSQALSNKRITVGTNGGVIDEGTLKSLDYKRDFLFPFSLLLHNARPIGLQDTLQLLISLLLLGDLAITVLTLIHFYWMSLGAFLAFLLILPLSLLSPFPAGLNALFSKGPKRPLLARVYSLWNATSFSNIMVALICGVLHYGFSPNPFKKDNPWITRRGEDDRWWILPTILLLLKSIQARLVDWHIANLEIQDTSLFSQDPEIFWSHQTLS